MGLDQEEAEGRGEGGRFWKDLVELQHSIC